MLTCPASTTRLATGLLKNAFAGAVAFITVGILTTVAMQAAAETPSASTGHPAPETLTAVNSATHSAILRSLPDGTYLYGQSPQPNRIGSAYMVLQVKNHQVAGAFYMPSSSFDCFQGEIRNQQLALTVVNREEQTQYPYSLALQSQENLATTNPAATSVAPAGYHAISQVSARDREILATCQAAQGSL